MSWLLVLGASLGGALVGGLVAGRSAAIGRNREIDSLQEQIASDRALLLFTLRRELLNHLMEIDPDRCIQLSKKAHDSDQRIRFLDKATLNKEFADLCAKYPMYEDFDLMGTREHVLYSDALSFNSVEDIEAHYLDLVRFHSMQKVLNPAWEFRSSATNLSDLEHLEKYVPRLKDTIFKRRLAAAIEEFRNYQGMSLETNKGDREAYRAKKFTVHFVPHFAETRYGVHFIDTNEYGLFGHFWDDARDRSYENYYRSNASFEIEIVLDALVLTDSA